MLPAWDNEREKRAEEIRTAVLMTGPPVWAALSLLTPADAVAPDAVFVAVAHSLERPGEAEQRLYHRPPVVSARIVEASEFPGDVVGAIRHHHERWDGGGYPQHLAGRTIPLASRIIHLAEVYDVLTSPSSYRRPLPREVALDAIHAEAGRQFDPELVPALVEAVRP